jgi:hypothetical protein
MKNIFLSIVTFTIVLSSCSSSENENFIEGIIPEEDEEIIVESPLLISKIQYTNPYQTYEYIYDNSSKLIKLVHQGVEQTYNIENDKIISKSSTYNGVLRFIKYTYSGDLLIKSSTYSDNVLTRFVEYSYSSNRLISRKENWDNNGTFLSYTVNVEINGNKAKFSEQGNSSFYSITTFDDKKHHFSGATYFHPILKSEGNINFNNPIKLEHNDSVTLTTENYNNEYNDKGYITKAQKNIGNLIIYTYKE